MSPFAPIGRKLGRPPNHDLSLYRSLFPEWSARTIARYATAMRRLDAIGYGLDQQRDVLLRVTRRNGTVNVRKLDAMTESIAAFALAVRERDAERP
jgi:hypothetical protein